MLPSGRLKLVTKPLPNRVTAGRENCRDSHTRRLDRLDGAAARDDHRHLPANEIRHERGHSVELAFGPTIFDQNVLAFGVASLVQSVLKRDDLPAHCIE